MALSIIIPAFNEEKFLPRLLESIKAQDFKDYEIIVADANSKDRTVKIAKEYGCKVVQGGRPAKGRNNGAKIAKGDILLFLDADVVLPKRNFLSRNLDEFKEKKLIAATCFSALAGKNQFIDHLLTFLANTSIWIFQFFDPHAPGYCIFANKEAHNKIKGFEEKITFLEDLAYVKKLGKYGKFTILTSVPIIMSLRRLKKEGRVKVMSKMVRSFFNRKTKGEITSDSFTPEWGDYN